MEFNGSIFQKIQKLVQSLTNNYKNSANEIFKLVTPVGYDGYKLLLIYLFENINYKNRIEKDDYMILLLKELFLVLREKQYFVTIVVELFEHVYKPKSEIIEFLITDLELDLQQQVSIGLGMIQEEPHRIYGINMIRTKLQSILSNPGSLRGGLVHDFLYFIKSAKEFEKEQEKILKVFEDYQENSILTSEIFGYKQSKGEKLESKIKGDSQTISKSLSGLMEELGYYCLSTKEIFSSLLEEFSGNIDEVQIARILGMMSLTYFGLKTSPENLLSFLKSIQKEEFFSTVNDDNGWNVDVFVEVLKERYPKVDYLKVIRCLDFPTFDIKDQKSLSLITTFYRKAVEKPFPVECFLRKIWGNKKAQLKFIVLGLDAPPSIINFLSPNLRKVNLGALTNIPSIDLKSPWNSLDLIETLLSFADSEYYVKIKRIFDYPLVQRRIQIFIGLVESNPKSVKLKSELMDLMFRYYLKQPQKYSFQIFEHLVKINKEITFETLIKNYLADNMLLRRILDIAQEMKCLLELLSCRPFKFSIPLAVLACRRDQLKLDLWIIEKIKEDPKNFVDDCLTFIVDQMSSKAHYGLPGLLTKDEYKIIFNSLFKVGSDDLKNQISRVYNSMDQSIKPVLSKSTAKRFTISESVEDWATQFFKSIFEQKLSIKNAIKILQSLRSSKKTDDQSKYACVIHNLFDEYRFFHQYPNNELTTVAKFFGQIISSRIISGKTLNYALYYVLKALSSQNDKMFVFGKIALNNFTKRLPEWPQFIDYLKNIKRLLKEFPDIWEFIEKSKNAKLPNVSAREMMEGSQFVFNRPLEHIPAQQKEKAPIKPKHQVNPKFADKVPKGAGYLMNISTLNQFSLKTNCKKPPQESVDKLQFILNNLSEKNFDEKFKSIKEIIIEEYFDYYSVYIVVNRASVEPKFHELYVSLVEKFDNTEFLRSILKITFGAVKDLFDSPKISKDISERGLFKNLGTWLGLLTIAKNRPIFIYELDLKEMLFKAYETGKMIACVPFVCKILNSCGNSKVLKPPNPWVMCLVAFLVEIHQIEDLKLNIKFDVEMLCKKLNIAILDVQVRNYLKDRLLYNLVNNPDLRKPTPILTDKNFNMNRLTSIPKLTFVELSDKVIINPQLELFSKQPELAQLVVFALDQAIKEIISPVVKRSVTIACRTGLDLVTKDFSMEKSVTKLQKSAHLMVQNLAANLAMVTCKEPLKVSMENHLRTYLNSVLEVKASAELQKEMDDSIVRICQDNVHVGSFYIEKAAIEKATAQINENLTTEVEQRKKYVATGGQVPWTMYHRVYQEQLTKVPPLPEVLLPTDEIGEIQEMVYQRFSQMLTEDRKKNIENSSISNSMSTVNELLMKIDALSKERNNNSIMKCTNSVIAIIQKSGSVIQLSLTVIDSILVNLFDDEKDMYLKDVFIYVINKIIDENNQDKIKDRIFNLWVKFDQLKKFSSDSILLINSSIIPIERVDYEISELIISSNNKLVISFGIQIIQESVLTSFISINQIPKIFEALYRRVFTLPKPSQLLVKKFLKSKFRQNGRYQEEFNTKEVTQISKRVFDKFVIWVELYRQVVSRNNFPHDQKLNAFVTQELQRTGILKTDTDFSNMCKALVPMCISNFVKSIQIGIGIDYTYIDGLTALVTIVIKMANVENKLSLLSKAFNVILKHLVNEHERNIKMFQQRAYLRMFSNLLISLVDDDDSKGDMLKLFSQLFLQLQPSYLPGFVFSWLELISHRNFMPKLLLSKRQSSYSDYRVILEALFKFLEPYLENSQLTPVIKLVYKGTLKILLVLLHDFSEFLCVYHFSLCDVIPSTCIQMRNLILSAFPRHMKLPDPFMRNLKVDLLPEINQPPKILSNYTQSLEQNKLKEKLESYLLHKRPPELLKEFKAKLLIPSKKLQRSLMNSMVLHIGINAIDDILINSRVNIINSSAMDIFRYLILNLDFESRYIFLNSIANQLRYPNNQTHYFSCVLLCMFNDIKLKHDEELIQEQITRVLLERLIVNRPHPWGLLITFIELVKNPRYAFWKKKFIHCAPSIEKLFTNVGKSCLSK